MAPQTDRSGSVTSAVRLATCSLLVGLGVLALKTAAWASTGSVALLSDALESVVNLATAAAALLAVRLAARPADAGHPYGHHKAEYLAAVLAGTLVVVAALAILSEAWMAATGPARMVTVTWLAAGATLSATAVNLTWARVLIRGGQRLRSVALSADGRHLMADVATSAGVLAGVGLAAATGLWWLDPLLAAAVAVTVLASGWQVLRASLGGLLDEAVPPATLERIRGLIAEAATDAVQAHDLRTRGDGRVIFVDFHLIVPGDMTVRASHAICDRIEARLRGVYPEASITIHVEPETKAKDDAIPLGPA